MIETNICTTVVSASDSIYQYWQTELLWESFKESKQPGNFLGLINSQSETPENKFSCPVLVTKPYSIHPVTNDDYPPYNKPASICQWLNKEKCYRGSVLLIDPDCIFTRSLVRFPKSKKTFCDQTWYLDPKSDTGNYLVKRFCRKNAGIVAPSMIPVFILKEDLAEMSARWLEITESIRSDSESKEKAGWVAEMWAYSIACAEYGISQTLEKLSCYPNDEHIQSIIHYCYDSVSAKSTFNKRYYKPWENTNFNEDGAKNPAKILNQKLNSLAAMKRI